MSLKTTKLNNQGFTIVELLIVVVVIAILAAITIVSYNGITNRANSSAAASLAANLQKKAELFATDGPTSTYPRAITDLTAGASGTTAVVLSSPSKVTSSSDVWYVPHNTIKFTTAPNVNPDATNGKDTVRYQPTGTGTGLASASTFTPTGATIYYWDFANSNTKSVSVGTTGAFSPTGW